MKKTAVAIALSVVVPMCMAQDNRPASVGYVV